MAVPLQELVSYIDQRLNIRDIPDFPGSENGLQVENEGFVRKIGASVDAGLVPFQKARDAGVDFLVVHHGLFWTRPQPILGHNYQKIRQLIDGGIALYGAHLPLDCHAEIGNNALLAKELVVPVTRFAFEYQGVPLAALCETRQSRGQLRERLEMLFSRTISIEAGPEEIQRIAILTGSGASILPELPSLGADTLITGEVKQHHFNMAQELGLNLFVCGHYETETFGVKALAKELSDQFHLPWEFLETGCPL